MRAGFFQVKTPRSRSSALLLRVTASDQRLSVRFFADFLWGAHLAGFLPCAISRFLSRPSAVAGPLEVLHRALVPLGLGARGEGAEVAPLAGLRVFLA